MTMTVIATGAAAATIIAATAIAVIATIAPAAAAVIMATKPTNTITAPSPFAGRN